VEEEEQFNMLVMDGKLELLVALVAEVEPQ
jgi:hypothetical protein